MPAQLTSADTSSSVATSTVLLPGTLGKVGQSRVGILPSVNVPVFAPVSTMTKPSSWSAESVVVSVTVYCSTTEASLLQALAFMAMKSGSPAREATALLVKLAFV